MFGIDDALIGAVAGPLIGGLFGSQGSTNTQTSQASIDPRMEPYVYGSNGVLANAQNWYDTNKTGLNSQMTTGMDNQWNQLAASTQGYNQMQNLGMGLMGGGVASNPFTGGGGIAPTQASYTPATFSTGGSSSTPFADMNAGYTATAAAAQAQRDAAAAEAARLAALHAQQQQTSSLFSNQGDYYGNHGGGGGGFGSSSYGGNDSHDGDSSHGSRGW